MMLDHLMTITPLEGMLAVFAAALLVQLLVFRAQVNAATRKSDDIRFPGLMRGLARIPVRTDEKRKR